MGKHNPPAFACADNGYLQEGMTLRDYFAGQALVGNLASLGSDEFPNVKGMAGLSYEIADAMLEARKK